MSFSSILKGWWAEFIISLVSRVYLNNAEYKKLDNLIIPGKNGTTEIDLVIVSKFGIFVIEVKNRKGLIYGGERDKEWIQEIDGRKFRFQNPLHQNYGHIKSLSKLLELEDDLFFSIVFFGIHAVFRDDMPENVMNEKLMPYILTKSDEVLNYDEIDEIYLKLKPYKSNSEDRRHHRISLSEKYESGHICPKCGGDLLVRTSKVGNRKFIGCSNFPKCKYTRK
ncbi:NERD domain-containing protein [Thiomicrospira microaerophila]|uniref:NERD domain-containing protein n=1 Tax=Thiomicrospira microaerophila TaxID=406020 RepID=UPI00200EDBD0|nr:NERD domain-containing protein [Thiomicrospira microaerophila]UQB41530.1 NERD domain-containing protein [Thiomicrospira microaerophila]